MPDHVHLIVHPTSPTYDISKFLARIKLPTSRRVLASLRKESPEVLEKLRAARGRRTEYHFWQPGGGFDRNITEPRTLERMIAYLHLNPVRKGLIARAEQWKWSSARYTPRLHNGKYGELLTRLEVHPLTAKPLNGDGSKSDPQLSPPG